MPERKLYSELLRLWSSLTSKEKQRNKNLRRAMQILTEKAYALQVERERVRLGGLFQ